MKSQEIIEVIETLNQEMFNNTGNEYMFLSFHTNGWCQRIDFLGCQLWTDDDDMREYNEESDEYEPLETYLRRTLREEIAKMAELLSANTPVNPQD
jgi:hypothetical protein